MSQVLTLLERGRAASETISALDAVMGEDWAVVDFDQARKAQLIRMGLAEKHRQDVSRTSSSSIGGSHSYLPGYRPQAVVKMVRKGGASDVRGLKAQMDYLSRDGEQALVRSERYMGVEIDDAERDAIESGWEMPPEGSGLADRTSHFIVSFPSYSSHGAAERAGRAWAEELFGSGDYSGDSYDYYTAFHTDRDHPHMHVVVNRRGMDQGNWLKVSRRSDLNYDAMRNVLVRIAEREGIELEATNRYERAIHDRPVPDAEYRRAKEERREVVAPEHTQQSAILAAAALIHHARRFANDARLVERDAPELAEILHRTSKDIAEGKTLTEQSYERSTNGHEVRAMSERLAEKRAEVRDNFRELDGNVAQLDPGADRVRAERQVAELKAQSAEAMGRDGAGLREYQQRDTSGRYDGMAGAEAEVRQVADRYGVNSDAAVERSSGGTPSVGLAREFAAGEARERAQSRADRGEREETPAQRDAALTKMHTEIGAIYREARQQATGPDRDWTREAERRREANRVDRDASGGESRSNDRMTDDEDRERADHDRSADDRGADEAARRAQDETRQNTERRTRQERVESETERWIREREAQEKRDRDGGRGV